MLKNSNVYLIGMMGAGKTAVGRLLARRLGYQFFDTDTVMKQATGQTITQLFAQGEASFRALETQVLQQLAPYPRLVVATGGGIVLARENWAQLHSGLVVWLDAPVDLLWQRVSPDIEARPLAQAGLEHFTQMFNQRVSLYRQADVIIDGAGSVEEVCIRTLQGIQERIEQDRPYIEEHLGR
ncbi:shikimate kinase [Anthocerotibacter panamensis]|uniref:shikimate kinase n=1 Tax=Anthocerotibacter panamensis TaxID=2857077 RepID=UPI001C406F09|nr:shikimate kinase [Anthocerotibacter panamensis]